MVAGVQALNEVTVTVTSRIVGEAFVYPYQRTGLPDWVPMYVVPVYQVTVGDRWFFAAVRFGLNPLIMPPPAERICTVGISGARTVYPTWVPGYSPHSFEGGEVRGAWRLLAGKQFLIHEGPEAMDTGGLAGSLGCVEIAKDNWKIFMAGLLMATGAGSYAAIGEKRLLKVVIQGTANPVAKYAFMVNRDTRETSGLEEWKKSHPR